MVMARVRHLVSLDFGNLLFDLPLAGGRDGRVALLGGGHGKGQTGGDGWPADDARVAAMGGGLRAHDMDTERWSMLATL